MRSYRVSAIAILGAQDLSALEPLWAPMTVVPAAMQLAWPPTLGALAMVATVACDELQ